MQIAFPYPGYEGIASVEVPDAKLMGIYAPRAFSDVGEEDVIGCGFNEPYSAPRLRDAVKPTDNVLVLV